MTTNNVNEESPKPKARKGFAAMDPAKVKEIASKGGKAAHVVGTAHVFSSDEARKAGRKGGLAPHVRRGRGPLKAPEAGSLVGPGAQRVSIPTENPTGAE